MCYFYPIKSGTEIIMELGEFFRAVPKAALGLSGGTDSSLLLYEGTKLGADIRPYFIKTAFQPAFELEDAKKICGICRSELHIIELDVLSAPQGGRKSRGQVLLLQDGAVFRPARQSP
jgi:PP-loop superfamily ATP-utilizing enzyme